MSLIKVLKDAGITSSLEFKKDIQKNDKNFGRWVLVLIGEDEHRLSDVVNSLITITHLKPKQAQAVALLAHFKGKAVVRYGDGDEILELAHQFEKAGIKVAIADVTETNIK